MFAQKWVKLCVANDIATVALNKAFCHRNHRRGHCPQQVHLLVNPHGFSTSQIHTGQKPVIAVAGVFTKYWLYHVPMVFVCRQLELHLQVKKNFKFVSVSVVGVRSIFVLTCKRMKWMIRHEHKRKWTRKNNKKKTKYWLLLLRNFPFSFWFLVNQGGNFKYVLLHC